jgi:hypothetical protein
MTLRDPNFNMYDLPPVDEVQLYVEHYFRWTGLIYPYIHQDTFLETLKEVEQDNFTKVRRTWLGMLNVILALATNIPVRPGISPEDRASECEVYYHRAQMLCDTGVSRGTSLELGKLRTKTLPHASRS